MNDERPGNLDYRVRNVSGKKKFDVYVGDELVAEGADSVEIRGNWINSNRKYKCEECGDSIVARTDEGWDCVICGGRMVKTDE